MNKIKHLQLKLLDKKLSKIRVVNIPSGGWIKAIRSSLGMSNRNLANRMGITKQSVAKLEENEVNDSITLKSLKRAAESMNCRLEYMFIPNEHSLEDIIKKQSEIKATEIVSAVDHTMQLEKQGVGNKKEKIKELAEEYMKNPNSKLWE